jgi:hypothetical protein
MNSETYRWYLCVQTHPDKWSCGRKTYQEVINPLFYDEKQQTKAVPVYGLIPRILDPFFLHKSLHPKVDINL